MCVERSAASQRSRRAAWAAAVLLAAAACGLACYDVPRRPSVETEFFVVHYREDRPPTPEELDALDFHFRLVGLETFSVPLSATPIHIHLYRDQDDFDDNSICPSYGGACYRYYENRVHSPPDFDYLHHELVHAYSDARCGRSITLLDEGLAETLTVTTHEQAVSPGLAELATSSAFHRELRSGSNWVPIAGTFVAWLVTWYGLDVVIDLACALGHDAGRARIDREFREHFGAGFEELVLQAADAGPDRPTAPCTWASLEPVPLALGETMSLSFPPEPFRPQPVTLDPAAVYARVRWWDGDWGVRAGLYQCGGAWGPSASSLITPGRAGEMWQPLEPGAAYMIDAMLRDPGAAPALNVVVEVLDRAPLADTCDPNVVTELASRAPRIGVRITDHSVDYPALDLEGNALADSAGQFLFAEETFFDNNYRDDTAVWVCPAGCAEPSPASCDLRVMFSPNLQPGIYSVFVVWYEPSMPPPDPGSRFAWFDFFPMSEW